jgi:hypothetical protein
MFWNATIARLRGRLVLPDELFILVILAKATNVEIASFLSRLFQFRFRASRRRRSVRLFPSQLDEAAYGPPQERQDERRRLRHTATRQRPGPGTREWKM